jgi:hypothetical protein
MVYARPYQVNRRLGEGISVFNPGDRRSRQPVQTNPELQRRLDELCPGQPRCATSSRATRAPTTASTP